MKDHHLKRIAGLSLEQQALLQQRLRDRTAHGRGQIQPRGQTLRTQGSPLSFAQERLFFIHQLNPDSAHYNQVRGVLLRGNIDAVLAEQALNHIAQRHEVLRTIFAIREGRPVQIVRPELPAPLPILDLSQTPVAEQAGQIQDLSKAISREPFDLYQGPLIRHWLLRLAADEHILLVAMHHIICDGWSIGLWIQETMVCYQALESGQPIPLAPLALQYADFALWQRDTLAGAALEEGLRYWKNQLAGIPTQLDLPTDYPRPATQRFCGARHPIRLSQTTTNQIKTLSKQERVSPFMTLLAALKILLCRYSGQQDIVVGTPNSNRGHDDTHPLIGFFVNMLALRTDLGGEPTFLDVLQRVRETTLGAYTNQDTPFEKIVEALQPMRAMSQTPVFQVVFGFQNIQLPPMEFAGISMEILPLHNKTTKFDLRFALEDGPEISGFVEYDTDLFRAERIADLVLHFQEILEGALADPSRPIANFPLTTGHASHSLIDAFNQSDEF